MKTCEGCRWMKHDQPGVGTCDSWACYANPGTPSWRSYEPDAPPACRYFEEDTPVQTDDARIGAALSIARGYGQFDGGHHKAWAIDQMCRALLGEGYAAFVTDAKAGEDGPETYGWDEGIAP